MELTDAQVVGLLVTIGSWLVGGTIYLNSMRLQVAHNKKRLDEHLPAILTWINTAKALVAPVNDRRTDITARISASDERAVKASDAGRESFHKIWSNLDDRLTPLVGLVSELRRDIERLEGLVEALRANGAKPR